MTSVPIVKIAASTETVTSRFSRPHPGQGPVGHQQSHAEQAVAQAVHGLPVGHRTAQLPDRRDARAGGEGVEDGLLDRVRGRRRPGDEGDLSAPGDPDAAALGQHAERGVDGAERSSGQIGQLVGAERAAAVVGRGVADPALLGAQSSRRGEDHHEEDRRDDDQDDVHAHLRETPGRTPP
nr:hypothetical protein GCM10020093_061920 [Planobispora longispora]